MPRMLVNCTDRGMIGKDALEIDLSRLDARDARRRSHLHAARDAVPGGSPRARLPDGERARSPAQSGSAGLQGVVRCHAGGDTRARSKPSRQRSKRRRGGALRHDLAGGPQDRLPHPRHRSGPLSLCGRYSLSAERPGDRTCRAAHPRARRLRRQACARRRDQHRLRQRQPHPARHASRQATAASRALPSSRRTSTSANWSG